MTFGQFIANAVRSYILNKFTDEVIQDIATNGLSAADEAVIDTYLGQTMP